MAKDISAVGAKIVIEYQNGGSDGKPRRITIDEFSDEGTPFDAPDIDVSTNAKNLNGEMISSRTPSIYSFSITVIPGTIADAWLHYRLAKDAIQPGNNTPGDVAYCNVTVTIPKIVQNGESVSSNAGGVVAPSIEYTYSNCRIKSGPTGPSTSAEGRLAARTYTFEAEGLSVKSL